MSELAGYERLLSLDERALDLIRQRTREVARRAEATGALELLEVLELVAREQLFALPLASVEGVFELQSLAALPGVPAAIRGLVSFHGEVLLAAELSGVLGLEARGVADLRRVAVVGTGGRRLAVLAEALVAARPVPRASFRPSATAQAPGVVGVSEERVTLLDPAVLVERAFALLPREGA